MVQAAKTIVIVDDDKLVQKTFQFYFQQAGYTVFLANNGREATAILGAHEVAVILLDVFMPEVDGIELLIAIKRKSPVSKVIVMSGGGMGRRYDFLEVASKFGADMVVRKPIDPQKLITMIDSEENFTQVAV